MAVLPGRRAQFAARLRWPWLVPGGWLVGITAAALLVHMPAVDGPLGVAVGCASLLLAVVLIVSVVLVALALAAAALSRVVAWVATVAGGRRAASQEPRS